MPEASNINTGTSPLGGLFAMGATGGATGIMAAGVAPQNPAAGAATTADMGLPGGFQAMLAAQVAVDPANGAAGAPVSPTPTAAIMAPVAAVAATGKDGGAPVSAPAPTAAAPAPAASAPAAPVSTVTALALNGNLPVGGKILPVGADADPEAAPTPETTPAQDTLPAARPIMPKAIVAAPRPRKDAAAAEVAPDETDSAAQDAGDGEPLASSSDGMEGNGTSPAMPNAMPMLMPNAMPAATANVAPPAAEAAPGDSAPAPAAVVKAAGISPALLAATAPLALATDGGAPDQAAASAMPTVGATPGAMARKAASISKAATDNADEKAQPLLAQASAPTQGRPGAMPLPTPGATVSSESVAAVPSSSAHAKTATVEPDAATMATLPVHTPRDGAMPIADPLSAAPASALPSEIRGDAGMSVESSRDMGALVDRLVETRAAMRSGAPAQWVQTSIQHAEFGRVALQIRQDGDNLAVAMTSDDPGFAPSAQAALQASHGLLQPAPSAQGNNPDASTDSQRGGQQADTYRDTSGQPAPNGQPGTQTGGQGQQSPSRQRPVFTPENPAIAAQTPARTAPSDTAPSGRTGILA